MAELPAVTFHLNWRIQANARFQSGHILEECFGDYARIEISADEKRVSRDLSGERAKRGISESRPHLRLRHVYTAGHVDLKLAMLIAVGFAVDGWFGGLWAQHLSDVVLSRAFAVLLVALAIKLGIRR